jgi:Alpha/beta hydrolase domain
MPKMNPVRVAAAVLAAALLLPLPGLAGPTDPVSVTRPPEGQGPAFVPGTRLVGNLPRNAYVEEEFFVSGTSTLFNYANNPPRSHTDITPVQTGVPYRTRLIVRRPADPADFDGNVVLEWWNSTAGFDTAPAWDPSADFFAKRGTIYVGVTNSTTAIDFLKGGCRVFGITPPRCGTRYTSLSLPENGLAFEMMSQIAAMLRSAAGGVVIPGAYRVQRLFHVGESQQGGSLITYASAFHQSSVNDGYFIQSAISPRAINFGPRCDEAGAPAFPACTPRLSLPQGRVRSDLPVPVYQVITQTDFETLGFGIAGRQQDTPTFRFYEVTGGAHNTVHRDIEIIPAGLLGPQPVYLEDLCANELNTTADGPVYVSYVFNALWHAMFRQSLKGVAPPKGRWMYQTGGALRRDANGNVIGGIRLPAIDVPLARYDSTNVADPALSPLLRNIGNLACRLSGSVVPFAPETVATLYPSKEAYLRKVQASTDSLLAQQFLLRGDAPKILAQAQRVQLP